MRPAKQGCHSRGVSLHCVIAFVDALHYSNYIIAINAISLHCDIAFADEACKAGVPQTGVTISLCTELTGVHERIS